jgi:hypothetical protein
MNAQTRDLLEGASLALTAMGALGLLRWGRLAGNARRAAQWPIVPGEVRHSNLKKTHSMFNMSRSGMGKGLAVYRAQVIYEYRVNGVRLEGRRVRLGEPRRERAKTNMQDLVSRYPVGRPVQVRYCPERPSEALLELGLHPIWREAVATSAAALTIGLAMAATTLLL